MRVQPFPAAAKVRPGSVASFIVWVWSKNAQSDGVTVTLHVATAAGVQSPTFAICPEVGSATCRMGNVPAGIANELQAAVRVGKRAAIGAHVQLIAKVTASNAKSSSSYATDVVIASALPPSATGTSVPGAGTLPPVSLPPIPGVGLGASSPGNASGLFPTVGPSATPGSSSLGLPPVKPHKTVRVTDAAAAVPLDSRLIGGQLAGLAVLAGAVVIAITRLSLRTPKPAEDKAAGAKPSAG